MEYLTHSSSILFNDVSYKINTVSTFVCLLYAHSFSYFSLMSFKVLNSIILLGHSYKVIEKYHESQDNSEPTNETTVNNSTANQNHASTEDASDVKSSVEKDDWKQHERRSSDPKVSRNFSQIFAADSFSELTMVGNSTVIEPSGGFTMRGKCDSQASSASDVSKQEMEPVQCNHELNIHTLTQDFAETVIPDKTNDSVEIVNGDKHWKSFLSKEAEGIKVPSGTVFQRGNKSILMSFGMRKHKRFGSSASLPETIGIPECTENDDANNSALRSEDVDVTKSNKSE